MSVSLPVCCSFCRFCNMALMLQSSCFVTSSADCFTTSFVAVTSLMTAGSVNGVDGLTIGEKMSVPGCLVASCDSVGLLTYDGDSVESSWEAWAFQFTSYELYCDANMLAWSVAMLIRRMGDLVHKKEIDAESYSGQTSNRNATSILAIVHTINYQHSIIITQRTQVHLNNI